MDFNYGDIFNAPKVAEVLDQLKLLVYKAIKEGYEEDEIVEALQEMMELSLYFAKIDIDFEGGGIEWHEIV